MRPPDGVAALAEEPSPLSGEARLAKNSERGSEYIQQA